MSEKHSCPKTDFQVLPHCVDTCKKLRNVLDNALNDINLDNIDEHEKVATTIKLCVEKVFPTVNKDKKKEP